MLKLYYALFSQNNLHSDLLRHLSNTPLFSPIVCVPEKKPVGQDDFLKWKCEPNNWSTLTCPLISRLRLSFSGTTCVERSRGEDEYPGV